MLIFEVKVNNVFENGDNFLLLLSEVARPGRFIPMIIGKFEAEGILSSIEGQIEERNLIYDVAGRMLKNAEAMVEKVVIYDINDEIFLASIYTQNLLGEKKIFDIRPADGIALALRFTAPIFISQNVSDKIADDESLQEEINIFIKNQFDEDSSINPGKDGIRLIDGYSFPTMIFNNHNGVINKLNLELNNAVNEEKYEEAARIRDRIIKLKRELKK